METTNVPHRLICASYSMSLRALRLKNLALSKLTPLSYLFGVAPPIKVTALEWQEFYIDSEQPYRDLKIAARDFEKASLCFEGDSIRYKFLDDIKYISGKGEVVLNFNPDFLHACLNCTIT